MSGPETTKPARIPVQVVLFNKEFLASCPPDEEARLQEAVALLNSRINEIKKSGKIVGTERIALMAALNITFELISLKAAKVDSNAPNKHLDNLCQIVDEALNKLTSA